MDSPERESNNFDLLRLFFASLVVFSHSWALLGKEEYSIWGRSLGNIAVHGFFVISGYLICQSFLRSSALLSFGCKRVLRIAPALVVALIFTKWVARFCDHFEHNPLPYIVNGPIWTLTWEVCLYMLLALLGIAGVLKSSTFPAFFASIWLVYITNLHSYDMSFLVVAPLALSFLAGTFLFVMTDQINIRKCAIFGAIVLAIAANFTVFQRIIGAVRYDIPFVYGPSVSDEEALRIAFLVSFPLVVIYLSKFAPVAAAVKHDISYGIYIFGFPAAQAEIFVAMRWGVTLSPIALFASTMLVTIPLAYASWRLVERPCISLKRRRPQPRPLEFAPRVSKSALSK